MRFLEEAIVATLENDKKINEAIRDLTKAHLGHHESPRGKALGYSICFLIGERLRSPLGLISDDDPQAILWQTFMGATDWPEVGRYFIERYEQ